MQRRRGRRKLAVEFGPVSSSCPPAASLIGRPGHETARSAHERNGDPPCRGRVRLSVDGRSYCSEVEYRSACSHPWDVIVSESCGEAFDLNRLGSKSNRFPWASFSRGPRSARGLEARRLTEAMQNSWEKTESRLG